MLVDEGEFSSIGSHPVLIDVNDHPCRQMQPIDLQDRDQHPWAGCDLLRRKEADRIKQESMSGVLYSGVISSIVSNPREHRRNCSG
jgi:RES domain-containing protein